MIKQIINFLHIILLTIPLIIFFIEPKKIKSFKKYIILIAALIPLHWVYFDDHCFLTIISKKMGDYKNTRTTSNFSEQNLKWLYFPIMKLFKWKWNSVGLDKMVTLHWIINIVLIWIYTFFCN